MANARRNWQHWMSGGALALALAGGQAVLAQSDSGRSTSGMNQPRLLSEGTNYEYESYNEADWWSADSDAQSRSMSSRASQTTFEGRITRVGRAGLADGRGQHMLIKVRNDQGREMIMDLGPTSQAARYGLEVGDTLSAQGQIVRKQDKQILHTREIEYQGQTINLRPAMMGAGESRLGDRSQQSARGSRMQFRGGMSDASDAAMGSERTVTGRVMRTGTASLPDEQGMRKVAEVRIEGGRDIIVDLGAGDAITLDRGDRVELTGEFDTETHGQQVLIASRAIVNGMSRRIERPDESDMMRTTTQATRRTTQSGSQAADDRDFGTYGYSSDDSRATQQGRSTSSYESSQSRSDAASSDGTQRLEGRVLSISQATGPRGRVTVLTLQTEDGRRQIVDVDPAVLRVQQVNLGDSVLILGTYGYRDDDRVLNARSIQDASGMSSDRDSNSRSRSDASSRDNAASSRSGQSDTSRSSTGSSTRSDTSTSGSSRSSGTSAGSSSTGSSSTGGSSATD